MSSKWLLTLLVSVVSTFIGFGQKPPSISYDSLKIQKASMKTPDTITPPAFILKGISLSVENGFVSKPLPGQEAPYFYTRFAIDPEFSFYGLKFNSSIMTSTEDLINGRNLSLFNFSLDQESVKQKLIELAKKSEKLKALDSLESTYKYINGVIDQVSNKNQSERYSQELNKAKRNLERAQNDTLYAEKHKLEIERSKKLIEEANKQELMLDSLIKVKNGILRQKQLLENILKKGVSGNSLQLSDLDYKGYGHSEWTNQAEGLKRKNQREMRMFERLSHVRNFQFANVYPSYSSIAFGGFQVKGFDIEWNNSKKYISTTLGLAGNNNSLRNHQGKHLSGRLGLGNLDENYGGLFFARTDIPDPIIYGIKGDKNLVGGVQLGSIKSGKREITFEHLYSVLQRTEDIEFSLTRRLGESIFKGEMNSATHVKYTEFLNNGNSLFEIQFFNVSPFFYAYGNQFLRSDIRRFDFKANHRIINNKLNILTSASQSRDNLNGYKSSTTKFLDYSLGFELKQKSNNFKFTYRQLNTHNTSKTVFRNTHILTFIYSKNIRLRRISNYTLITGNYVSNIIDPSAKSKNIIISLSNTTRFNKGISFEASYSYRINGLKGQEITDSISSNQAKFSFGFPLTKFLIIKTSYSVWYHQLMTFGQLMQINSNVKLSNTFSFSIAFSVQTIEYLNTNANDIYSFGTLSLLYNFQFKELSKTKSPSHEKK
jgi:hypothetical protein